MKMDHHRDIWDSFCARMNMSENSVPLFRTSQENVVETKTIGVRSKRSVLCRSIEMEQLIRFKTDRLVEDWETENDELDGLIYMMFWKDSHQVTPLYIGKTETIGKGDRN